MRLSDILAINSDYNDLSHEATALVDELAKCEKANFSAHKPIDKDDASEVTDFLESAISRCGKNAELVTHLQVLKTDFEEACDDEDDDDFEDADDAEEGASGDE